jgi:UDP-2,4-diacetamido-2,4,6-trideoxy-beta-L-altropyranose hydrolase
MKIAIRADGGHNIGYGHFVRTSVLAKELIENGHDVKYYTKTSDCLKEICQENFPISEIQDEEEFLETLNEKSVDVVITDHYEIDEPLQNQIRENCKIYLAISDDTRYNFNCDILVNGNIYAEKLDYHFTGQEPEILLGADFNLIREGFQKAAQKDLEHKEEIQSCLVMMGGGDTKNFTPKVMRILKEYDLRTTVIIGPGFKNKEEIRRIAYQREKINTEHNPENLAEIMQASDIAISATGTSVYELVATKTPFIGIPQADNQKKVAKSIEEQKLGIIANENNIEESIKKLTSDKDLWNNIRERQNQKIDGEGAKRIRNTIEKKAKH